MGEIPYRYYPDNNLWRRTMKCPHLMKWVRSSCKAFERPYTPSMFELEEYCRRKEHRKCPFYLKDIIRTNATEYRISV
jgi:hypothetical protein